MWEIPTKSHQGERMTFLLNPQTIEGIATVAITIYHRYGLYDLQDLGLPTDKIKFDIAYTYYVPVNEYFVDDTDMKRDLERIFRENNAVDGTEVNVQLNKRSLSVGDVVEIQLGQQEFLGAANRVTAKDSLFYEVASVGFEKVAGARTQFALAQAILDQKGVSA